jgi:predicted kinase
MPILRIFRGLPGSGKSTRASKYTCKTFAADDWFTYTGTSFHWAHLADAHSWCYNTVRRTLASGEDCNVANTFIEQKHLTPYISMAREVGAEVEIVDLFDGGCTDEELRDRNIHDVPLSTIKNMRNKYYNGDILKETKDA